MEQNERPQDYWELSIEEQIELQKDQTEAIEVAREVLHIAEYGRYPLDKVPFGQFLAHGCPCFKCVRDEFL